MLTQRLGRVPTGVFGSVFRHRIVRVRVQTQDRSGPCSDTGAFGSVFRQERFGPVFRQRSVWARVQTEKRLACFSIEERSGRVLIKGSLGHVLIVVRSCSDRGVSV
ncbi:hypothetical protein Baya_15054 [Bagarius yarrelli]|uniref:Uncharacterized protein n=1 Tax=Bagarius yarrelli TaxID=175774 RepID=A0A556VAV6_BAGYA|nr:hypothetical protein Baya_15054 [Bagarius yarrelli]